MQKCWVVLDVDMCSTVAATAKGSLAFQTPSGTFRSPMITLFATKISIVLVPLLETNVGVADACVSVPTSVRFFRQNYSFVHHVCMALKSPARINIYGALALTSSKNYPFSQVVYHDGLTQRLCQTHSVVSPIFHDIFTRYTCA